MSDWIDDKQINELIDWQTNEWIDWQTNKWMIGLTTNK